MYDSLNSGSVAAIMDDEPVIKYAIKQGRKFKTPIKGTPSGQLAFAVKKGENPELIEMFNNGLANLKKSGQYQRSSIEAAHENVGKHDRIRSHGRR